MSMNTKRGEKRNISSNFISNKDDAVIKKEKVEEVVLMDPSVLTTRLNDMCILQKPLLKGKPKNIIDKIHFESIAAVTAEKTANFEYVCRCSKKIKKRRHHINFKKLREKLESKFGCRIKFESADESIEEEERIEVKKRSVTAVVEFSSDDDEYLLSYKVKRNKVENTNCILYNYLVKNKEEQDKKEHTDLLYNNLEENKSEDLLNLKQINSTENYTELLNNLDKFVEVRVLKRMSGVISDCSKQVIVVNNKYSQTTDIYVTDKINRIFEFVTVPIGNYSIFNKLLSFYDIKQKNKPILRMLWIDCCCWVQRQQEIKRVLPRNIAHYLFSSHTCHLICSCCCNEETSKQTTEPTIDCDTEVYPPKEDLDTAIEVKDIRNPLIQLALSFKKPKSKHILNTKLKKQHKDKNPSCIQFIFKTVSKKNKQIECKVSASKGHNKTEEALSNNQLEFVQLDLRRELLSHSFNVTPKKASMLSVNTLEGLDVCCEMKFKCFMRTLCLRYNIGPAVFKYIEGIHKCNIYRKYINRPDKCPQCKDIKICDDKRAIKATYYDFEVSSAPIEHTRKVIKGQIVQDEKEETIQEIMEKVKTRFPNMSYYINDQGLPTASLPMPFHHYPIEDIRYLTQVMEFSHKVLTKQKNLLSGSLQQVKSGNEIMCDLTKELELQTAKATRTENPKIYKNNKKSKPPTIQATDILDLCNSFIKRNKELYVEAFRSFVNTPIEQNKMTLQEGHLPKIVDVYSLTDNKEIAQKLHDANPN